LTLPIGSRISCVDWPAGANFSGRVLRLFSAPSSIPSRTSPMARRMPATSSSGASLASLSSRASSMLIDTRSA
jgi:hypothetical protein